MAGETYAKRYAGGFADGIPAGTPADSTFLNAVEAALLRLLGEDPAADEVPVWTPGSNRFVFQKLTNASIDAAAAISKSKLGALGIVDADVSAIAAIAKSKLAALNIVDADVSAISSSKITGLGSFSTYYRKITSKTVNTTTTKTDLLNGEITLAANDLSTNKRMTLRAHGDFKQNSGGVAAPPRLVFDLGGTTILDTSALSSADAANSAVRFGWEIEVTVQALTATTQSVTIKGTITCSPGASSDNVVFATGEGMQSYIGTTGMVVLTGWNSGSKDGTGTLAVALSTINGSANANYEVVLKDAMVVIE